MIKITNAAWASNPYQTINDFYLNPNEIKSMSKTNEDYHVRVNFSESKDVLRIPIEHAAKELSDLIEGGDKEKIKLRLASVTIPSQLATFNHKSIEVYRNAIESVSVEDGVAVIYTKGGLRIGGIVDEQG